MNCKKALMGFAALLVVVFHFYIPVTGTATELFLVKTAYVGVDLFIFLSALSLGKQDSIKFGSFIKNRLRLVYLPFFILCTICLFYKKWSVTRYITAITGIEFLQKGGGAFMWFAPAVMLVYLAAPALVKCRKKLGNAFLPAAIAAWFVLGVFVQYVIKQPQLFILINRLPAFMIGLCFYKLTENIPENVKTIIAAVFLAAGTLILIKYGFKVKLNVPFKDMCYVLALPSMLAIYRIFELLYAKVPKLLKPLEFIGTFTLELYGCQMAFGYDIMGPIMKQTGSKLMAFLITCVILIIISFIMNRLLKAAHNVIKNKQLANS